MHKSKTEYGFRFLNFFVKNMNGKAPTQFLLEIEEGINGLVEISMFYLLGTKTSLFLFC